MILAIRGMTISFLNHIIDESSILNHLKNHPKMIFPDIPSLSLPHMITYKIYLITLVYYLVWISHGIFYMNMITKNLDESHFPGKMKVILHKIYIWNLYESHKVSPTFFPPQNDPRYRPGTTAWWPLVFWVTAWLPTRPLRCCASLWDHGWAPWMGKIWWGGGWGIFREFGVIFFFCGSTDI